MRTLMGNGKPELTLELNERIKSQGPLRFDVFMEAALYHPEHGYYSGGGNSRVGRQGDFYTSVSVGSLFGELLACHIRELWSELGQPESFTIYEQGANDASLAADILGALSSDSEKESSIRYHIIEPHERLRQVQKKTLEVADPSFVGRVTWSARASEVVKTASGCFLSNELLDAFPVRRVVYREGVWKELCVACAEKSGAEKFVWVETDIDPQDSQSDGATLLDYLSRYCPVAVEGFTTEVCLDVDEWFRAVSGFFDQGSLLTIDYGFPAEVYYSGERSSGTLRAYHQHEVSDDLLASPGEQDLTASVNFSRLMDFGESLGWKEEGFTDQHRFLVGLAQQKLMPEVEADPLSALSQKRLRQFKTLMHPELMGSSFRVLLQTKGMPQAYRPAGFYLSLG